MPKKVREKTKMRRLKPSRLGAEHSTDWEEVEVDLEAGGIYQILERGRPTCTWMSRFMTLMRHLKEPLPTIYGIPLSTKSRLTRHKKAWRTFEDWALERFKTLPVGDYLTSVSDYDECKSLTWSSRLKSTEWQDELDKNSEVYKLLKDIERWNANRAVWREEASQVIAMLTDLRIDTKPVPSKWNFASREAKLTSEYPLVTAFIRHAQLYQLPAETMKLIFDNLA